VAPIYVSLVPVLERGEAIKPAVAKSLSITPVNESGKAV
jgi:hypothetical protein